MSFSCMCADPYCIINGCRRFRMMSGLVEKSEGLGGPMLPGPSSPQIPSPMAPQVPAPLIPGPWIPAIPGVVPGPALVGWFCPRCGAGVAPNVPVCPACPTLTTPPYPYAGQEASDTSTTHVATASLGALSREEFPRDDLFDATPDAAGFLHQKEKPL